MDAVLAIEQASFEFAWTEEDFLICLRQRNCIGMVATYNDRVIGFMIYELKGARIDLLNFVVAQPYRRHRVGTVMLDKLKEKIAKQRRTQIGVEVRETNLDAQLFFKSAGFKALRIVKDRYDSIPEDAYLMRYTRQAFSPKNRISEYLGEP